MKRSSYNRSWIQSLLDVWCREFRLVFRDAGVILFFLVLPTAYPILYTLMYNPELVKDVPVVVLDNSRTPESRHITSMLDATEAMKVAGYVTDMAEGKKAIAERRANAIISIPADYAERLGRNEQAYIDFFSETSRLLRYRGFVSAITDVTIAAGAQIQEHTIAELGGTTLLTGNNTAIPVKSEAIFTGDPTQGFASFVLPGILVIILQQSLLLGITMIGGGVSERARANGGTDPLSISAPPSATVLGKALCYIVIYTPMAIFGLHYVPLIFSLPHLASVFDFLMLILPMLLASIFLGIMLQYFSRERESSLLIIVFTSPLVLFLTGLTWPRFAMSGLWYAVSSCFPATWGVNAFIRMNGSGSGLWLQGHDVIALWIMTLCYFIGAYLLQRYYFSRFEPRPALSRH